MVHNRMSSGHLQCSGIYSIIGASLFGFTNILVKILSFSFDATYLYEYTFILLYNLVFTSLPVISLGGMWPSFNPF